MIRNGGRGVKEVFQGRQTMGVGEFGVQRSDINGHYDGVGRENWGGTI